MIVKGKDLTLKARPLLYSCTTICAISSQKVQRLPASQIGDSTKLQRYVTPPASLPQKMNLAMKLGSIR
jgi:hypothetical protein